MRKFISKSKLVPSTALSIVLSLGQIALAQDAAIVKEYKKHLLPNAISIQLTDRGLRYLEKNTLEILTQQGLDPSDGYFNGREFVSQSTLTIDEIAKDNPEAAKIIKQVRDLFTEWLVGFELNNHRPGIQVGDTGYLAQIKKLSVGVDRELLRSLQKSSGVVLSVELELKDLTVATKSIRAYDKNNTHLGEIGLQDVAISMKKNSPSLKLKIPFFVDVNPQGAVEFNTLTTESNFEDIHLDLRYKKLLTPQISLNLNGRTYNLNQDRLHKEILAQTPAMFDKVLTQVKHFADADLPQLLNKKAIDLTKGKLEFVNYMPPLSDAPNQVSFVWGLRLTNLQLTDMLSTRLTAFVEDPTLNNTKPLANSYAKGPANLNAEHKDTYDLAIAIDRVFVNRILQLNFERGIFSAIQQDDGTMLKLTATPLVDAPPSYTSSWPVARTSDYIKLNIEVEQRTDGFKENLALKNPYRVRVDVLARLTLAPDGQHLAIQLIGFDYNSLLIPERYYKATGKILRSKVQSAAINRLKEIETPWRKTTTYLPGQVPVQPPLGLNFKVSKLRTDRNGHILLYMTFGGTK